MRLLKRYELFVYVQCPLHTGIKLSRVDCPWAVYRVCSVYIRVQHSVNFPRGVVHRVENGWGLTKVAAVLLNGLLW